MGGRGASSGLSDKGKPYGSQYKILLQHENIKFVTNIGKNYEPLMETMTKDRMYVQIGGEDIVRIVQMGEDNKRNKVIEKDKRTGEWHVHHGYFHTEDSEKHHEPLNRSEQKLLDNVKKIWHNRSR